MNLKLLLGLLASVTMIGVAAERTWTGGGTDSKWSTVANWGGTAPTTGDTLVFAGSTKLSPVNDLPAGTVFGGIAFKSGAGAFTLSGNTVSIQGYITNGSSSAATVAFGIDLAGPLIVLPAAGNLAFTGPITGTGTYVQAGGVVGAKTVTLSGTNTFTGDFIVTNGTVVAKNPNVFGNAETNVVTFESNDAQLQLDCGAGVWQIAKQLRLGPDKNNTGSLRLVSGEYEILKETQLQGQVRISVNATVPRLTFKESVRHYSGSGLFIPNPPSGSEIVFEKAIDVSRQVYADTVGILVFKASGNKWNSLNPLRSDLRAMATNVFPTTLGVTMGGDSAMINLLGNDQTVQRIETALNIALPITRRSIYSPTPATLTMNAAGSASLCASFDGVVSLLKGGQNNTKITMTGLVSTTYGNVTITNGTLAIALGAGFPNASNITVRGANSMLDVGRSAALPNKGNVILENGGKLQLLGGTAQVINRLYINGIEQVAGIYSASELPSSIQGAGTVEVLAVDELVVKDTVWDGGAAPDAGFATSQNWVGDETPNFVNGFANLVFATGGTNGIISGLIRAYGLVFMPGTEFAVQEGTLELGAGGIRFATDSSASITNRVLSEIVFSQPLTLAVTNAQAAKAVLELGRLNDGGSGTAISLSGTNACYVFRGSNTFGNLTVPAGVIVSAFAPEPLGGGSGTITVNPGGWIELYDTKIVTKGAIVVLGDPQSGYNGALRFMTGTNVVTAPIGNGSSRVKTHGNAVAELDGGMTGSGSIDSNSSGGWIRFRKNPVQMSHIFYNGGFLIFACTNNSVSAQLEINGSVGSLLRFDVTNAFSTMTRLLHRNSGAIDLNGCDQRIGVLDGLTTSGIIYSVQPAVLTIDHSVLSANGYPGNITGRVSVVKTGVGTNLITGTSTTFGSFTVENGCLDVSGSFGPNSTNVFVKAGSLIVRNSSVISDAATVSMTGGKIELADGVRDVVYELYLDGSLQNPGTYGSTQSPAQYKMDTYFGGTGVLRVLSGKPGTRIILR